MSDDDHKTFRDWLKLHAGDLSPYAPDPPLPFRPLVHLLTWDEAELEAFELARHYMMFNGIDFDTASCVAREFTSSVAESVVPRNFDASCRANELDGDYFTKAVIHELRAFFGRIMNDSATVAKFETTVNEREQHRFTVSVVAQKNQRRTMEDRHTVMRDMEWFFGDKAVAGDAFFGVFDGHAGSEIAQYASTHAAGHVVRSMHYRDNAQQALRDAFDTLDHAIVDKCKRERIRGGCTAVLCLVRGNELSVAWAGDSHAVIVDAAGNARTLTTAHCPDDESEYKRIEAAGGMCIPIQGELRVNGVLNLSRSLGDCAVKPVVIATPDVVAWTLDGSESLLLLCCDGVWDALDDTMYNECLTQFAAECTDAANFKTEYPRLAETFAIRAKSNGSTDNLSVVCVSLKSPSELWKIHRT